MNSLRISGYNPKLTTSTLLYELFCQGGPIKSISLCKRPDDHAIVRFHHDESVPYCLALFEGIQLHGRLLRMNPLRYNKSTHLYTDYLREVRHKFRDEYAKITPPPLPPKTCANDRPQYIKDRRSNKKKLKKRDNPEKKDDSARASHRDNSMKRRESHDENTVSNQSTHSPHKKSPKIKKIKDDSNKIKGNVRKNNIEKKNTRKRPSQKQRRRNRV